MVMIHSNAYDHIVQISVRAKQMKLNQANTNTHTHYANHNIHTHKRTLRTLQIGHSRQQQQITAMSREKKKQHNKK